MSEGLNLSTILIPLLALLVGWAIGFFDSNMRTSRKIKQAEDSAQAAIKEAQVQLASIPKKPAVADASDLMRIKDEEGTLILDLDGTRVNTSSITADQRKRLIEMLNAMRPWLEGKPASAPAPVKPAPPPSVPAQNKPAPTSGIIPPPQPMAQPQAPSPKPPATPKKEEVEAAPTSIVGQINMILQERIVNTPLASRGVSLMESITGGVNVFVGVQRYDGIDDVPNDEIKAAIRAAIVEWENKYTPGL